jgi:hypothetical protein
MRTTTFTLLLLSLVCLDTFGQSTSRAAKFIPKPMATISTNKILLNNQVGTRSGNFFFNPSNSTFVFQDSSIYTYDASGRLLSETIRISGLNLFREEFVYDAQGRLIERRDLEWNLMMNVFQLTQKDVITFDAQGNQTFIATLDYNMGTFIDTTFFESAQYVYNAANRVTQVTRTFSNNDRQRDIITYNASNQMTSTTNQVFDSTSSTFINNSREQFLLAANGRITQSTYQEWNGTTWETQGRTVNIVWQNWVGIYPNFGDVASYQLQIPVGSTFMTVLRHRVIYGTFGSKVEFDSVLSGTVFVPEFRSTTLFDAQTNLRMRSEETWTGTSYEIDFKDSTEFLYNAQNGVTRITDFFWNNGISAMQATTRKVFANFITVTGLQVLQNFGTPLVEVFPNPVQDYINIALPESAKMATAVLVDAKGKVMANIAFSETQRTVDMQALPPGVYMLRITTDDETVVTKRLVKQ